MDTFNIGLRWYTPTNRINGITASVSYLSLPSTFSFIFTILSFFPAQSNNIYHIFYDMMFEIHRRQPFNQRFFLFGCVDNTLITVLNVRIIFLVFVIVIDVFHAFHIFNRIISISMWHIIFISTWSIYSFRIINNFITVLMLQSILSVFVIVIVLKNHYAITAVIA